MIDSTMLSRILTQCSSEGKTFVADANALAVAQAIWKEAVAHEREACAKVCDFISMGIAITLSPVADKCASSIRARKD